MPNSFHPTAAATKNIAATTSSGNVQLCVAGTSPGMVQFHIYNSGAATAFIRQGLDNTIAATVTADMPIAAGSVEVVTFTVPSGVNPNNGLWVAAIMASGTGTIYFTPGVGI